MSTAKNAILKAKIEGVIYEVMVKTTAANVYVDENTTLAAKLASIVADIATKASTEEMNAALALKSDVGHGHAQSEITGLTDLLATLASTQSVTNAIDALRQEMLGDTPVEAYNTFTELAAYIAEHQEAADALSAAIGNKADKSTVEAIQQTINGLGALATLDEISEDNLSAALKEKVNAAAEGNHSHSNKSVLDGITAQNITDWNDAVSKEHEHANKAVLDGITSAKVAAWDAAEGNAKSYADGVAATAKSEAVEEANEYAENIAAGLMESVNADLATKARIIYAASEPADLTDKDLWVQLV